MREATHRIRRLRWQVRADSTAAALAWRTQLHAWLPEAQATLAQALDELSSDGEVRHLPQLHVRLRLPAPVAEPGGSTADWPATVKGALQVALQEALQDALRDTRPEARSDARPRWSPPTGDGGHTPPAAPLGATGHAPGHQGHFANAPPAAPGPQTALLCALSHLRERAPQALQAALQQAWAQRQGDHTTLVLQDTPWRVDATLVQRWLAWPGAASGGPAHPGPTPQPAQPVQGPHGAQADASVGPAPTPSPQPPRPTSVLAHAQAQLHHFLLTGRLDWAWAGLPPAEARAALREAATQWLSLGLWPDALAHAASLAPRLGIWGRWLTLLDGPLRAELRARLHAAWADAAPPAAASRPPGTATAASGPGGEGQGPGLPHRAPTPPSPESRLLGLLHALALDTADGLHALALALDGWRSQGGRGLPPPSDPWWPQARDWARAGMALGPAHDAWTDWLAAGAPSRPLAPATGPASPADAPHRLDTPHTPQGADGPPRAQATAEPTPPGVRPAAQPDDARLAAAPPPGLGEVVAHAGLVLLHPYLPRCLDALGLWPAGSRGPLPDAIWPRAAALLHWLSHGDDTPPLESDLALVRCLLGRADDPPLTHSLPTLLAHERDEAQALLTAVTAHWRALKGTTVGGLRHSFLQRPGWLGRTERGWLLRVEPASFDLLLTSLPWTLSLVKLPWMPQPLHVEWTTP